MCYLFGTPKCSQEESDDGDLPGFQAMIAATDALPGPGTAFRLIHTVTAILALIPASFPVQRAGGNPQGPGTGVHAMPVLH
jgi:hypothetical protein